MRLILILSLFLCCAMSTQTFGEIVTRNVDYTEGDMTLEGYLAYDDATPDVRPGVLIVHQWKGLGDYEKMRAHMLAEMGYVVFALDIYGKGKRATDASGAAALAGQFYADRDLFRRRLKAGLEQLKRAPHVDTDNVAAIGYCFGGTGVLELARSGADIDGVVSFHGGLKPGTPDATPPVRTKVLVLHGADDPHVPAEDIAAFRAEMDRAGADWQLTMYSGAVHAFTDKGAGDDPSRGAAYNERADKRSWTAMQSFFAEIFNR